MATENGDSGFPTISDFDLLPKIVTRLDRHLIFPLLEFSAGQIPEDDDKKMREITQAKFELLKTTNMTDFIGQLYCEIEGIDKPPAEYETRKKDVLSQMDKYQDQTEKLTELLGREDVVSNLRSDKVANLEFLKKEHEVRQHIILATRCEF